MAVAQQKKSKWQQFRDFLVAKEKDDKKEITIEGLPANMVKLVLDKKLKEREDDYNELLKILNQPVNKTTLNSYVDDLTCMVQVMHSAICRIAIPFIRARDSSSSAKLASGWAEVVGFFLSECEAAKRYWGNDKPLEKEKASISQIHINNLHTSIVRHYMTLGFKVLSYSFSDLDVRPNSVTVIQNMMPQHQNLPYGFGPPQPTG